MTENSQPEVQPISVSVGGVGVFTPPPSPCGNPECGWVELDLIHVCGLDDELYVDRSKP